MDIRNPILRNFLPLCAAMLLVACGGGGDVAGEPPAPVAPAPPPPPPPPVGIGAAGGTVTHAAGASVVVPAGALTQNVVIEIAQSAVGAPALPAGVTSAGSTFAFTPHGTAFAVAATVTVPFDPALVPAGLTPILYKTNAAQTAYEPVAGAVVSGNSLVGQISGFSLLTTGTVIPPVASTGPPVRYWSFSEFRGDELEKVLLNSGGEINGDPPQGQIDEIYEFGPAFFDSQITDMSGSVLTPPDGIALGDIASNNSGTTYWVGAEAPLGLTTNFDDPIGSEAELVQIQTYLKNAADATYHFTLTSMMLETHDGNGSLARSCPAERVVPAQIVGDPGGPDFHCDLISASVWLSVAAYSPADPVLGRLVAEVSGGASLTGSAGAWTATYWNENSASRPLWSPTGEELTFAERDFNGPAGHAVVWLGAPRTYALDISKVEVGHTFEVVVNAGATTYNRANSPVGGQGAEFETSALAWLRDPATVGGTTIVTSGLTPVATTLPVAPRVEAPVTPAPCVPGPGPDPAAGTLQFSAATFAIGESGLTPVVLVTRTGGSLGAVTATLSTGNGSAVAGVDYTANNSSVSFASGDAAPRVVRVPLINDSLDEPDETVNLTLSQPGGCAALGAQTTAVLTIRDDDVTPQTLFTVGGTVTGLTANSTSARGLELIDHHGLSLIITADGPFTFTNIPSPTGTAYSVRTGIQPLGIGGVVSRRCAVTNGSGVIANANVTDIQVICTEP
jgi:hypothetical protein